MVHRPADSRLLINLLQQEKEYSKQLGQVIESSNASLALFAAYAAASSVSTSRVIMAVASSLAAADESFRLYAAGVEEWREAMRSLKDAEEEVGNIMRDREILVTRLIKASKPKHGSGSIRDSLLSGMQHFPSSSSLSVGNETPSPTPSRPMSMSFSSSTKLAAAQSELQACEAHLAMKERELEAKRNSALRDGLGARMQAMVDCGWAWHELGKGALQSLDELKSESASGTLNNNGSNTLHVPEIESTRPSSDFSSIGPSQSASQVNAESHPPLASMDAVISSAFQDIAENKPINSNPAETNTQRPSSHTSSATESSLFSSHIAATYQVETVKYAPAIAVRVPGTAYDMEAPSEETKADYTSIPVPAPHALNGYAYGIPTATSPPVAGPSRLQPSGYSTPQPTTPKLVPSAFYSGHTLERRITEDSQEDRRQNIIVLQQDDDVSSFEEVNDEQKLVQAGKLAVVENPRFMTEARKREIEKEKGRVARNEEEQRRKMVKGKQRETQPRDKETDKEKRRFSLFHHNLKADKENPSHDARNVTFTPSTPDGHHHEGERVSPSKLGFFGTIRGLFTSPLSPSPSGHGPTSPTRSRERAARTDNEFSGSDDDTSPTKTSGRTLQTLFRPSEKRKPRPSAAPWETRTEKNINRFKKQTSFDDGLVSKPGRTGLGLAGAAVVNAGVVNAAGVGRQNTARGRSVSDMGTNTLRAEHEASYGKRLRKSPRPTSTPVTGDMTTPTSVKGTGRRSASVDEHVDTRKSRFDYAEVDEGMIIDLGRRRVASEAGATPTEATRRTTGNAVHQDHMPQRMATPISAHSPDVFGPAQTSTKGYLSDPPASQPPSGAMKKKKNLTKKREQGVTSPAPAVAATPRQPVGTASRVAATPVTPDTTPAPVRKSSIRSTAPSTKSPLSQQSGSATILVAGGEHPSGILVQQPGWDTHAQGQGGTLSRHSSVTSAANAPASSGNNVARSGKRRTPLGQGVGGSGGVARRASLSGVPAGKVDAPSRASTVIHPLSPAQNLMSIIEDVARTNREGWKTDIKTRKSVGGSQKAAGLMEVVKAPPSMDRAQLEALDAVEMRNWARAPSPTPIPTLKMTSRTGMFEIKAPGSVFDQRQVHAPSQSATAEAAPVNKGIKHDKASRFELYNGPSSALFAPDGHYHPNYRAPLRSALRNASRSPSPAGPIQTGVHHYEAQTLPAPVDGILPWGSDGTLHQSRKLDKGKQPMRSTEETDPSGDDSSEIFYSDLEEVETGPPDPTARPAAASELQPQEPISTAATNGHATGHQKTTSEVSQSSTSTYIQGSSSAYQPPRRRKSVRVSLQPTFSPSPPAIEYDDEEEQRLHAPWAWHAETSQGQGAASSSSRQAHAASSAPLLPAPVALRAPVKTVATEPDMWADSSDEDEEYSRAKRALTRAAKKERDTKVKVANSVR